MKKDKKVLSPVERLVSSMGSRLATYKKNKERITAEFKAALAKEDQKIADVTLQIKALKK